MIFGEVERADRFRRTIIVVSDSYVPFYIPPRMNQFRGAAGEGRASRNYLGSRSWSSLLGTTAAAMFFEGYEAHSMYKWDPNRRMQRSGGVTPGLLVERRPGWVLRGAAREGVAVR